jgi:phospholipid/cholesterol/gamma-HCH transport system substrate-binding protein
MNRQKVATEVKVGAVVICAILVLFYMSFRIGKMGFLGERGYDLVVYFDNAGGLDPKTPVQIAGVEVGKVKNIKLEGYKAKVTLLIREGIKIPADSKVVVKAQGALGDKYIELKPGVDSKFLARGETIKDVITTPDFDQIFATVERAAKSFGDTMDDFKGIIGPKEKEGLKKSIENIQVVSGDFKEVMNANKENVTRFVNNATRVSEKLNGIVTDVEQGKGTLGLLIKDETLYKDAKDTVASFKVISTDIEQGKGTIGKLVKDEAIYNDAKDAVNNIKEITAGIQKGEGSLGKLAKDDTFYNDAGKAVKKIGKAADGITEMTPITILGTIIGTFF